MPLRIVFLESICDDPRILSTNYRLKLFNDDYKCRTNDADFEATAKEDFQKRVLAYEQQYEPLTQAEITTAQAAYDLLVGSLRVSNGGKLLELSHVGDSHLCADICPLLQSMHLVQRTIWLMPESSDDAGVLEQLAGRAAAACKATTSTHMTVLCGKSRRATQVAWRFADLLDQQRERPISKHVAATVLSLRNLAIRQRGQYGAGCCNKRAFRNDGLPAESFTDLAWRLRDVILRVERLRECVLVLYPDEEVRDAFLGHFTDAGPQEYTRCQPIIELLRKDDGFAAQEICP
jgi:hypothetical protein